MKFALLRSARLYDGSATRPGLVAFLAAALLLPVSLLQAAGTVGEVVTIRGHVSDIALDEMRGRLYVANFTANRIEVIGVASRRVESVLPVAPQPGSIALSPSGTHLLVTHFGNRTGTSFNNNAYTILNLQTGTQQNFGSLPTPLAASFGNSGKALVVTSREFLLMDPANGTTQLVMTVQAVAESLPVVGPKKPAQVVQATMTTSRDGMMVFGLASLSVNDDSAEGDFSVVFRYDMLRGIFRTMSLTASPPMGPRVVSSSRTGATYMAGWGLFDLKDTLLAQFPNASGRYDVGTHVFAPQAGVIYAQFQRRETESAQPASPNEPTLLVLDDDNLAVRARYRLPENLAGKSILSADERVLYSISESGIAIIDVGALHEKPRLAVSRPDVLFETSFASRDILTQEIEITDPNGGRTPFVLNGGAPGISIDPPVGHTPARVRIHVDPQAYRSNRGTTVVPITIASGAAVNVPDRIRILINTKGPDQRGRILSVPGKLVDILPDPIRNRFYVLRQDTNQVLIFDSQSFEQIGVLRTGNTPYGMAITPDNRHLLVGNDDSGIANVFDLQTLMPDRHVIFPIGHYPRSIAASNGTILAACRVAGQVHMMDRIDFIQRRAVPYTTLGIYTNDIPLHTKLSTSPGGETIYAVGHTGQALLYEASSDTFVVFRKDYDALQDGYGALGSDFYAVGSVLLNSSLVRRGTFDVGTLRPAGYAAAGGRGLRVLAESSATPGLMERFDLGKAGGARLIRLVEAPLLGNDNEPFTRVLAPLSNGESIVMLSTSGIVVVPWNFDDPVPTPKIDAVVNSANFSPAVAPGGLISIFGSNLAPSSTAASRLPLPSTMGETVVQLRGTPIPLLYVSPNQVNAQLPFGATGRVDLQLINPGGESIPFSVNVQPVAPSVFESGTAGPRTGIPIIVRAKNNQLVTLSNPVHPQDILIIYATGLGDPVVPVGAGAASPSAPLAHARIEPQITLGGDRLEVLYAGLAPGFVGVYQINVAVPWRVPLGMEVPLVIRQGTQETVIKVRVVQ